MKYDVRLQLEYAYRPAAAAGRHLVHVAPTTIADSQRVVASSITFDPVPVERVDGHDFFGNAIVSVTFDEPHAMLKVGMSARVQVESPGATFDVSPDITRLRREIAGVLSLAPDSPHHFTPASPRIGLDEEITAYAREAVAGAATVREMVRDFGQRIHDDFVFDAKSTEVDTAPKEAFELRRGVCQDFTQVMIAGLRGLGIPAGYVSGFLRTTPPPGKERLAGADAMHAWVQAWCGNQTGWVSYDPTNAVFSGEDHIVVAKGRDYQDVTPIFGVLRTSGRQRTAQSVDVIPV
jgi:transglutaminase-like putative cysteine protease